MGILERIAKAETSHDLKHHGNECDVDVLGAVGMAAINNTGYLAVYRLKYLRDRSVSGEAFAQFTIWARRSMLRRSKGCTGAPWIASKALEYWVNDRCAACSGLGYAVIAGTPCLSDNHCCVCRGSGKRKLSANAFETQIMNDVIENADAVLHIIGKLTGFKLYEE